MKRLSCILSTTIFCVGLLSAQPMSGNYTVGGTSPIFATPQDAANAIKARGVSGPVFINIRPGTYMRDGGTSPVLVMDSIVVGVSATNRITFQPDAASGGNVNTVTLQADFNSIANDGRVTKVSADYVTLRNLTFKDADSLDTPALFLVDANTGGGANTTIEGLVVDGCRFLGNPNIGSTFGTDVGIGSSEQLQSTTITNNRFYRLSRAVSFHNGFARGGAYVVEDNEFYQGYGRFDAMGNSVGAAIDLACVNASVKRNIIDFANGNGCFVGIGVYYASTAVIERNHIKNHLPLNGGDIRDTFGAIVVADFNNIFTADSITIANNMIAGNVAVRRRGIDVQARNTKVLNNTIVNGTQPWTSTGLLVIGSNCTVLNNIINEFGVSEFTFVVVAYDQGSAIQSPGLISNHNVIYRTPQAAGALVTSGGQSYVSLGAYQAATGRDTNSISKTISFLSGTDLHLDQCQAQDPDLIGIPFPGILEDYDGDIRSTTQPLKGSDETGARSAAMFADPFSDGLQGTAFSIAAGRFDNILLDGLAVPDYDNRQVLLYHNLGNSRSFVRSGTLQTGFRPVVVKFFDLDQDNLLDLIVGGDTTAVKVFWGDSFGNFPSDTTIITRGRVRSLDTGKVSFVVNSTTILITEDNGFLPNTSWLAYLDNDNGRHLSEGVVQRPGPCCFNPDTIPGVLTDFIVGDFDGNSDPEIAALTTSPLAPAMYVFNDTNAQGGGGFLTYGTRYRYQLGTGSAVGHASSIVMGDFDGDADLDLLATGSSSACVFIRNLGNFTFSSEAIPVNFASGVVNMDYENDGDLDFVTVNELLNTNGVTVFLNDGTGHFSAKQNCFLPFASGRPYGVVASDFDMDGRTDIAVVSALDSLFVLYNLGGGVTGVGDTQTKEVPALLQLSQNYPNPFNPVTVIRYSLVVSGYVTLKVYNLLGQQVATIVDGVQAAGSYDAQLDATALPGGVYFYQLRAGNYSEMKKMMLVK